ncbi:MAG: ATP-binding protein [Tepidiformaceae bacterium]
MTGARPTTATILFTDLVDSTPLWQRAGEERARQIVQAHHRMLRDVVAAHGGNEVKSTGDGLMAAFASVAAAVRCAVAMQQAARRPAAGERLQMRAGWHTGEMSEERGDYFGTAVSLASRLCGAASAGQIVSSATVQVLLAGHAEFAFRDLGALQLKGMSAPVAALEVLYEHDPRALLDRTPFVGRAQEVAALRKKLDEACAGHGGLAMLVGEPGIGKTRTAEEFAEAAARQGAAVLWGRCYEGEWAPPFSPFAEAIRQHAVAVDNETLRRDLGGDAGVLARIVPALRERLPDIAEPPQLQPEGERFRLLDAVGGFLTSVAARAPLVLVLDDLHWADKGTIAMLRHAARETAGQRLLILGAYRDVELNRQHPLAAALADLRRERSYERVVLRGLDAAEVGELLDVVAEQDVPEALAAAISAETEGNPFFVKEVLQHLIEEGKLVSEDGRWTNKMSIAELGIPEGIRDVIGRRLSRLSDTANRMLTTAAALTGGFTWQVLEAIAIAGTRAQQAAALPDGDGSVVDALEEALTAQVLAEGAPGAYDFTHALIRHTLYDELSTPRRVQIHHQIGESLERIYAGGLEPHLAELAHHFYQAAPGGDVEKAIDYAKRAGDRATTQVAYEEAVIQYDRALQALDMHNTPDDLRRCRLLLAMGEAQMSSADVDGGRTSLCQSAAIAEHLGEPDLLADAALVLNRVPRVLVGTIDEVVVSALERALAAMPEDDSERRAFVLAALSTNLALASSASRDRAETLAGQAVEMATRLGSARALTAAVWAAYWLGGEMTFTEDLRRSLTEGADTSAAADLNIRIWSVELRSLLALFVWRRCWRSSAGRRAGQSRSAVTAADALVYWHGPSRGAIPHERRVR